MLNDFHMMVLAIVASQGGIAALLAVMAKLEPAKTDTMSARRVAPRPTVTRPAAARPALYPAPATARPAPAADPRPSSNTRRAARMAG